MFSYQSLSFSFPSTNHFCSWLHTFPTPLPYHTHPSIFFLFNTSKFGSPYLKWCITSHNLNFPNQHKKRKSVNQKPYIWTYEYYRYIVFVRARSEHLKLPCARCYIPTNIPSARTSKNCSHHRARIHSL